MCARETPRCAKRHQSVEGLETFVRSHTYKGDLRQGRPVRTTTPPYTIICHLHPPLCVRIVLVHERLFPPVPLPRKSHSLEDNGRRSGAASAHVTQPASRPRHVVWHVQPVAGRCTAAEAQHARPVHGIVTHPVQEMAEQATIHTVVPPPGTVCGSEAIARTESRCRSSRSTNVRGVVRSTSNACGHGAPWLVPTHRSTGLRKAATNLAL